MMYHYRVLCGHQVVGCLEGKSWLLLNSSMCNWGLYCNP